MHGKSSDFEVTESVQRKDQRLGLILIGAPMLRRQALPLHHVALEMRICILQVWWSASLRSIIGVFTGIFSSVG